MRKPLTHTVRVLWVEPPDVLQGMEGETDEDTLRRGVIDRAVDDGAPGPAGRYRLLPEEIWRTVDPDRPAPAFLHEAYEALLERWVNSLPDAAVEVTIVARARDAAMQLVETHLAPIRATSRSARRSPQPSPPRRAWRSSTARSCRARPAERSARRRRRPKRNHRRTAP